MTKRTRSCPELRRDGLHLFDAWAKQYGDVESVYEVAPSGVGYRISQRFSKFRNLPSLMGHYRSFADVVTLDDLKQQEAAAGKRFPVPKIQGGRPQNVVVKRSQLQTDFFGVPKVVRSGAGVIQFELQDPTKAAIEPVPADPKMGRAEQTWAIRAGGATLKSGIATEAEAREQLVAMATTPRTELDPKSLLGQFANLRELTRSTKGKINALSLTGLANKAGLDYRLIDPAAPDHPGSKINQAVQSIVKVWKDTAADRGTQLVFCDLSVPLSARAGMAAKPKRAYVRDADGRVTHKQATLHTIDGWEGYPFYMVKSDRGMAVYEPVSGVMLRDGFADKAAVTAWASGLLADQKNREKWLDARDRYGELTDDQISEYRDQKELETEPDGSNELSRADLEAVAGASAFSVYDDMKAKLVAAGIPAAEIEFVHDHDTPSAKDKLFKRVKAGTVRVLFGSTPKMGAGTNVQDRLVGLHHVDAPWRPSDLEQREGRIIRRGNMLYERDPDGFEVFIGRYATEQTYDTRRWQLLEHKAAGIEQLRNYAGQAEIEDVASEAANAADMKAAASGNPLILQETQLRTEVRRLESLEKAHKDNVLTMARRAADQQQYADRYGPEKLANLRTLVADRNAVPFDPENPSARIGGKAYTGKEAIQKRLAFVVAELQTSSGSDAVVAVEYRGLPFFFKGGTNMVSVEGPAGHIHSYGKNETVSTAGLLTRLGNAAERLDAHVVDVERHIARAAAEAASLRTQSQQPFADAQLLKDTKAKHGVVQRNLMKASQGEAVSPAERGEFNAALKERRAQLEKLGFGAELKASDAADVAFSRANGLAPAGGRRAAVEALASTIAQRWASAPEIVVVEDMNDPAIPAAVRQTDTAQRSQGASGEPEGFFHAGKVYLLASQLPGDAQVVRVLFHEALGHYGLRGTFGDGLGEILDNLARLNAGKVREKAKQYGLDYDVPADRRMAAEEVLAEMAQKSPTIGWVQRAVAAVRAALRRFVPGFGQMALSDGEIIRDYILPARAFVQRGGPAGGPGGGVALSRSSLAALRSIDQKSVRNAFLDATTSHASTTLWGRTVGK
ncbi:hypothetical protein MW290_18940 [Aquincola tertiaricarbonis]|uniref:Helicase C-terminal domain-containing protein n=1 Tax=Aquincola tertiaricarbonis TaxID=391953 RepID=A0ABY4SCJ3_AQUTE|nr:hypothetical protein [Aquincola tertiaricarbonis]URI11047.1 hypothetical protein MW290_18940 [Aquincola tertiaricarbonis]